MVQKITGSQYCASLLLRSDEMSIPLFILKKFNKFLFEDNMTPVASKTAHSLQRYLFTEQPRNKGYISDTARHILSP